MSRTIDLTGLPPEAVRVVESLVSMLRDTVAKGTGDQSSTMPANDWAVRLQAWVDSHPKRDIDIDDSRESIYAGRGE